MPRITKEEKARNRQNIVEAAGRMFRARGIDAVGIADLMKEAGLTHGGFYNHFASKDDLAAEVCNASFAASLGVLRRAVERGDAPTGTPLRRVVEDYLSAAHRDARDGGCPSASLVVDAGRQSEAVQREYAAGVEGYLAGFAAEFAREGDITPEEARERAVLLLSRMVGAMVLARAVRHVGPELSDEILRTCRTHALD
ncbi:MULTISPECIES: TetR/AcrR family transcriptional regulator [unclassified Streptomyces]|uniref:TetR/AcrR family transcriptional regulator n=1 Tax=Streptomyces TaxID=1883 RepID=UPI001671C204|nr:MULTISPECIES: TetR/AcrR family transcriptional regulator [unclassified Streptomyces]MCI4144479.1 TetR/AcrR family transcriptional regulator [Streptomyces sp. MMS20-AI2-20]GGQ31131.1 TetR family transcriptional regulator [Streptomyces gancidicus]